jgi:tryptophanyl-tRNA synthetase
MDKSDNPACPKAIEGANNLNAITAAVAVAEKTYRMVTSQYRKKMSSSRTNRIQLTPLV